MSPGAARTNQEKAEEVRREVSCAVAYSNAPQAGTHLSVPRRLANVHARAGTEDNLAAADQPVKRVTIVGGGTAGWMTAAVLSQWLSKVEIKLIESEEIGTIGVGEATIPHIRNLLALAGVDPLKLISESKATFKLGIQFIDWGAPGENYIHGFGKIGRDMLWLHPHQLWLAARERVPDRVKHFDFYSMCCVASLKNRFAFPDKRNPNSPLGDIDYAYHFDASLVARSLR